MRSVCSLGEGSLPTLGWQHTKSGEYTAVKICSLSDLSKLIKLIFIEGTVCKHGKWLLYLGESVLSVVLQGMVFTLVY